MGGGAFAALLSQINLLPGPDVVSGYDSPDQGGSNRLPTARSYPEVKRNKRLALLTTNPIHQDSIANTSNSSASAEKISCLLL